MIYTVIPAKPFLTTNWGLNTSMKLAMISSARGMLNRRMIASSSPISVWNIILDINQNTMPHIRVVAIKTMALPVVPSA